MAKYYVQTGNMKEIVVENDPEKAAIKAFVRAVKKGKLFPGILTVVSETGFAIENDDDLFMSSDKIAEKAGLIGG